MLNLDHSIFLKTETALRHPMLFLCVCQISANNANPLGTGNQILYVYSLVAENLIFRKAQKTVSSPLDESHWYAHKFIKVQEVSWNVMGYTWNFESQVIKSSS